MADPITWGLLNLIKKRVKGVQTTLDGVKNSVDTLPEDVQTKLDAFEVTIDELKKNVEDSLADVQETVENSPAGILPPSMQYIKCVSNDSGVNVTYKANLALSTDGTIYDYIYNNNIASITKGVMVRYRTDTYPLDINDGKLAFIDEDISEFVTNKQIGPGSLAKTYGVIQAKEKTQLVTGLTQNQYYYFTAFPFSSNNVYLEAPTRDMSNSTGINCIRVQWTGTKGTLTVNVTQDYDYKPLGEYTATLTPTAGGDPITKTQSGVGTVVFSGLEAGEYTLSFSSPQYFMAPQSQSVTVTAGQSQSINVEYKLSVSLSSLSWDEIIEISDLGIAEEIFQVGDSKSVKVKGYSASFTGPTPDFGGGDPKQFNVNAVIVGFNNHKCINTSKPYSITFMTDGVVINAYREKNRWYSDDYFRSYLQSDYGDIFPELNGKLKKVEVKTVRNNIANSKGDTTQDYLFPPCCRALGYTSNSYVNSDEDNTYPYFSTSSKRLLSTTPMTQSSEKCYSTRSPSVISSDKLVGVNQTNGEFDFSTIGYSKAWQYPLCFCV